MNNEPHYITWMWFLIHAQMALLVSLALLVKETLYPHENFRNCISQFRYEVLPTRSSLLMRQSCFTQFGNRPSRFKVLATVWRVQSHSYLVNWFWPNEAMRRHGYCPTLTRWGQVTHICVSKLATIGLDNVSVAWSVQAIIWTNDAILLIGYIFILDLTPGFNRLNKDNGKTRRESFQFCDLIWCDLH